MVVTFLVAGAGAAQGRPGRSDFGRSHRPVCGPAAPGFARCLAEVVTDPTNAPLTTAAPAGYGPGDLRAAYGLSTLSTSAGAGQTLAIVDAYDDPTAEADLGVYRSRYGLSACTTSNGCFAKVNQRGGSSYPSADAAWAQEISLDLDMASAVCPNCRILLVEADSSSMSDLGAAVDRAAALGATQISNSYGSSEYRRETTDEAHYNHPGVAITASSGDSGYGVSFPAASRYVTAVGGTSLVRDATAPGGWTESAWSGAGSGCSAYVSKPTWQADSGCGNRAVVDVAAVADPTTGVAVYDSFAYQGTAGWMIFGGTSVSAPIVAAYDALIGISAASPSYGYAHPTLHRDVVAGSNGTCGTPYLCTAGPGYDGPTGWGTIQGSTYGAQPTAATTPVTAVGETTATATGNVNPNGSVTSVRFDYGTTTSYGLATTQQTAGSDNTDRPFAAALSGLSSGMSYHYRIVATTDCSCAQGTVYGADATFTTTTTTVAGGGGSAPAGAGPTTVAPPSAGDITTTEDPTPSPVVPPPVPVSGTATRLPAGLRIGRVTLVRGALHAEATITRAVARGIVRITFRTSRSTSHFTATAHDGALRFTRRLPRAQRHAGTGILTITYPGNDRVRPGRARIRATYRRPSASR